MKKIAIAAIACLMLAACSAGPSKGDVEKALAIYIQQVGGVTPTTFQKLEVGKCVANEAGAGYVCTVDADFEYSDGITSRSRNQNMTGAFVLDKLGDEWKVIGTR